VPRDARVEHGGESRFLYNLELAWQDGRVGNPSILDEWGEPTGLTGEDIFISAWGGEGLFGYNWNVGDNDHRVYAHAYFASGDRESGNRDDNNFRTLFQDFHWRNGRADMVKGTNLETLGLAYEGHFGDKHVAGVDLMGFRINRAVQNATQLASIAGIFEGLVIPSIEDSGFPQTDKLGSELDLWYDYFYTDHLSFNVALSLFFPGEAIQNVTESNDPATRLTAQARLRF